MTQDFQTGKQGSGEHGTEIKTQKKLKVLKIYQYICSEELVAVCNATTVLVLSSPCPSRALPFPSLQLLLPFLAKTLKDGSTGRRPETGPSQKKPKNQQTGLHQIQKFCKAKETIRAKKPAEGKIFCFYTLDGERSPGICKEISRTRFPRIKYLVKNGQIKCTDASQGRVN